MSPNCSCSSRATDTASMADVSETKLDKIEKWAAKQSFPVEAAVTTFIGSVQGAFFGVVSEVARNLSCVALNIKTPSTGLKLDPKKLASVGAYRPLAYYFAVGSRLEWARNFAIAFGVDAGISCVMKKLTGNHDVHTSMVAGFGAGVMFSLATGMRGPDVLSVGIMYALVNGVDFKVKEKSSQPKAKDVFPDKTREMFSSIGLGFDQYAMNFNTCLFTEDAFSLLTDRKEMRKGCRRR